MSTPAPRSASVLLPLATRPAKPTTQVGIAGVRVLSDTVEMTVTVRCNGAGDLLYEPPVLMTDNGQQLMIDAASLEVARYAFLALKG